MDIARAALLKSKEQFSEEQEIEFYHSVNDIKDAIRQYGLGVLLYSLDQIPDWEVEKLTEIEVSLVGEDFEDNFDLTSATHNGTMVVQ
jgi:hypothetical protein